MSVKNTTTFTHHDWMHHMKVASPEHLPWMLAEGLDIHERDELGFTVLHAASQAGNASLVKALIDAGADINATSLRERGALSAWTPLHVGSFHGQADAVKVLLEAGADVEALEGDLGDTALRMSARRGHVDVVKHLICHGADLRVLDGERLQVATRRCGFAGVKEFLAFLQSCQRERH